MEVSGQVHVLVALLLRKEPLVPIGYEAGSCMWNIQLNFFSCMQNIELRAIYCVINATENLFLYAEYNTEVRCIDHMFTFLQNTELLNFKPRGIHTYQWTING
jgi:hypothetical protein